VDGTLTGKTNQNFFQNKSGLTGLLFSSSSYEVLNPIKSLPFIKSYRNFQKYFHLQTEHEGRQKRCIVCALSIVHACSAVLLSVCEH
jgi:hypothetical protein